MQQSIIVSGFGGQGVLFTGQLLGYSAMVKGIYATWIPSYGPEMRGGTANCSVTISDAEISSPFVSSGTHLFAFNSPSVERFLPILAPSGILLINSSLMRDEIPDKVRTLAVPATQIAEDIGSPKSWNMVMVGVYLETQDTFSLLDIQRGLEKMIGDKRPERITDNLKAIEAGATWAKKQGVPVFG